MTRKEKGEGIPVRILDLLVQPGSGRDEILGWQGGRLKIRISFPPEGGKANEGLRAFLAREFGIRKEDVEILSGWTSRRKRLRVSGLSEERFRALSMNPPTRPDDATSRG